MVDRLEPFSWKVDGCRVHRCFPSDDGRYVSYTDYAALQAENERLNAQAKPEPTQEDAACPILALAPAEYTYWEKRVWRRGVRDLETRREVAEAVRKSQDESAVQS